MAGIGGSLGQPHGLPHEHRRWRRFQDEIEPLVLVPEVDWLNDRLFRFDAREEIHAWTTVERVEDGRLVAASGFRKVDWERDRFHAEIKSATYHGLRLERQGDLWVAEVIFDL